MKPLPLVCEASILPQAGIYSLNGLFLMVHEYFNLKWKLRGTLV